MTNKREKVIKFGWVGLGWVLWHVNLDRLFNGKFLVYKYIKYI